MQLGTPQLIQRVRERETNMPDIAFMRAARLSGKAL